MLYAILKLTASSAFVVAAVAWNARPPFLIAFVLSWLGDALLIPRKTFLAGLGAFLLAHVAFSIGFAQRGIDPGAAILALVVLMAIAIVVWRWLAPHVKASMRVPVLAYIATIVLMATLAVGTREPRLALGAILFFASDLAVARQRFVAKSILNKVWGLPLYYAAQFVLAASAS